VNRSYIDHIVRLQDNILKNTHNRKHTLAVFLNFSKAFNMVWKKGFLHKLHGLGTPCPDTERVAAAFYIPELEYRYAQRLENSASVFAAEMEAMRMALQRRKDNDDISNRQTTIYSDSLSSATLIHSQNSKT